MEYNQMMLIDDEPRKQGNILSIADVCSSCGLGSLGHEGGEDAAMLGVVARHVQLCGGHDLVLVLGLAVVVHELHVGVDQVHDDGVVHDVVLVLVLRARREVNPA